MRKRKYSLGLWLNQKEYKKLKHLCEKSGLNANSLLRSLITNKDITIKPSKDYNEIKFQLSAIGNNLNQTTRVANATGNVNVEELNSIAISLEKLWRQISKM